MMGARQMGFLAEIEAKKWVFKGESFNEILEEEREEYSDKYLRMIGLFQMGICASPKSNKCVDTLITHFSLDNWLSVYLSSLSHSTGPT